MSQQLILELSDEDYASLEKKATSAGLKVSDWIMALIEQQDCLVHFSGKDVQRSVATTALLSEQVLAEDWNKPEEDAAWAHLQSGQL